jgi:sec-independent protein translocase protein TatC
MESFWKHLDALRACFSRIALTVGGITLFVFLFDIRTGELFGFPVMYPYPDVYTTISTRVFLQIKHDLLPASVRLIALTPWAAMFIQFQISLMLGVIIGMPMIVYQMGKFLGPALKRHEKRLIIRLVLPATVLFIMGNLFAYYLIIPFSIDFLYNFAFAMGVEQYFSVEEFFSFVLMFVIAFGVVFELPVIMVGLSSLGIVSPDFWKEHWRWAVLISMIFSAIITPDGTGVTMFMVAIPMLFLYFIGYIVSKSNDKMLTIGLMLAGTGCLAVLLSVIRHAFSLPLGVQNHLSFGLPDWLVVGAGTATFLVGLSMVGISLGNVFRKRVRTKR